MTDAPVALAVPPEASPAERLAAALSGNGAEAAPAGGGGAGWFLFETPEGQGALRVDALTGLAQPPALEADGPGAARRLAEAEPLIADVETALGLSIEPRGIGEGPAGVTARVTRDDSVLRLTLPQALTDALPAPGSVRGTQVCAVEIDAPALPEGAAPGPGDLLLLGAAPRVAVTPPRGVPIETRLGADAPTLAASGGAVVSLQAPLTEAERAALSGGAPLALAEGPAPRATLTSGAQTYTGDLVPLAGQLAFRFDPT